VDVTGALNAWIDSVPDHVTLSFQPNACYRLDGTIRITARNGLTLEGNGATFKAGTDGDDERRQFWFVGGTDLTVRNVVVRGANPHAGVSAEAWSPAHEWQHGFALNGVQRALLDGVQAYDVYGDFVYLGPTYSGQGNPSTPSRNITVRNSHFERNGRQGFGITGVEDVLISNNYMSDVRWDMFDLELNDNIDVASRVSIVGNTTGIGRLLWFGASGAEGSVDHIYIAGNTMVDESATPVVYVEGSRGSRGPFLVENNHFLVHHTSPPVQCESCSGAVVRNNVFDFSSPGQTVVYALDSGPISVHDNDVRTAGKIVDGDAISLSTAVVSDNQL
jgi:hypothetical protein